MSSQKFWSNNQESDNVSSWRNGGDKKNKSNNRRRHNDSQDNSTSNYSSNNHSYQRRESNQRNRNYRDNRYNRSNYYRRQEPQKPEKPKEFNIYDHPELLKSYTFDESSENTQKKDYVNKCRQTKEDDIKRNPVQLDDPKYWNGCQWIGPRFMKYDNSNDCKNDSKNLKQQNNTENNITTTVIPHKPILYSRDTVHWHSSWENTFSQDEWNNMEAQEDSNRCREVVQQSVAAHEKNLEYDFRTYCLTGEVSGRLQAHFDQIDYEKYDRKMIEEYEASIQDIPSDEDVHESDEDVYSDYST